MTPGEYRLDESSGQISANAGRRTAKVMVKNTGDRPIQVGSHFHFFETNRFLAFDREAAYGMRLNIAAGTAARFEPGEAKQVELVDFGGHRIVQGFSGLVAGTFHQCAGLREARGQAVHAQAIRPEIVGPPDSESEAADVSGRGKGISMAAYAEARFGGDFPGRQY